MTLRRERYAALLFDVDGTLAETEELHRRAFNDSFAYFGLPWVWDFALYRELLRVTGGKEPRERVPVVAAPAQHQQQSQRCSRERSAPER